jgi:hypothetical protein
MQTYLNEIIGDTIELADELSMPQVPTAEGRPREGENLDLHGKMFKLGSIAGSLHLVAENQRKDEIKLINAGVDRLMLEGKVEELTTKLNKFIVKTNDEAKRIGKILAAAGNYLDVDLDLEIEPDPAGVLVDTTTMWQQVIDFTVSSSSTGWKLGNDKSEKADDLDDSYPVYIGTFTEWLPRHIRLAFSVGITTMGELDWNNLPSDARKSDVPLTDELHLHDIVAAVNIEPGFNIDKSITKYKFKYANTDALANLLISVIVKITLTLISLLTGQLEGLIPIFLASAASNAAKAYNEAQLKRSLEIRLEDVTVPSGEIRVQDEIFDEASFGIVRSYIKPRKGSEVGDLGAYKNMVELSRTKRIEGHTSNFITIADAVVAQRKFRFKPVSFSVFGRVPWDKSGLKELIDPQYLSGGKLIIHASDGVEHPEARNGAKTLSGWNVAFINDRPYAFWNGSTFLRRNNEVSTNTKF